MDDGALTPEQIETVMSVGRIAIGAGLLAAPARFSRSWVGEDAERASVQTAMRGLGARDVALGLGGLLARRHGQSTRGWLEAAALADLGDATATLAAWDDLPPTGRWLVLAMAGGAAAVGAALARVVDD